jgi:hypothetical protein
MTICTFLCSRYALGIVGVALFAAPVIAEANQLLNRVLEVLP